MSRFLVLSVRFFDNRYHGQYDDGEPEWPPSPFRLFQALLAGAGEAGGPTEAEKQALRWLEEQAPPLIRAPLAETQGRWLTFVPINQADVAWDRQQRLTGKESSYVLFPGDHWPQVHYLWPLPNGAPPESLFPLARRLLALGRGVDQASCHASVLAQEEAERLPGLLWRPVPQGPPQRHPHRVPVSGSLEDLLTAYASWRQRLASHKLYHPPRAPRVFATVYYFPETQLPPRPFAFFRLPEGLAFRQENAAKLAAMVRGLCIARAREDGLENAETYVAGHVGAATHTPPRFSYLPLPSIGHPHADGLLRRVLVAEPFGGDGAMARWAERALHNTALRDEDGNILGWLRAVWQPDGVLSRYLGPGRLWRTVTPVILPGHDDRKPQKALKLVKEALSHASIPQEAVEDVILQKAPFWPGSSHPSRYFRPHYLRCLPAWHVRVLFRDPVTGPLAIGAGRHVGLGLLATG